MSFDKYDKLCLTYEVPKVTNQKSPFYNIQEKVRGLTKLPNGLHIHLVADDSGSMSNTDKGETQPRYLEQRDLLSNLAEWGLSLNVPVFFSSLNGKDKMTKLDPVTGPKYVYDVLSNLEYGYTPLYDTLKPIFEGYKGTGLTKLIFVGTDGGPTTNEGMDDKYRFLDLIKNKRDAHHNHIAFLACVGGDKNDPGHPLHYINDLDGASQVDCFDDFDNEKEEISEDFRNQYTKGLHFLRMFSSTFYRDLDNLDGK